MFFSYLILKALFVLEIFKFSPDFLDHAGKRLDKKAKVHFKICDLADWTTNNYISHIARYLKK